MSVIDKEKENNIFERSKLLSDDIIRANFIRSIWFFNIHPTLIYMNVLDNQKSLSIIDSIFGHPPPIQCKRIIPDIQYNWFAHCLRKLIKPNETTKFDEYKLFLTYLSKSRGSYATNIKRFLSIRLSRIMKSTDQSSKDMNNQSTAFFDSEGDEIIVFQSIFEFYNNEPTLFFSFRSCYYNTQDSTISTISKSNNTNSTESTNLLPIFPDHFLFPGSEARLIAKLGNRILEICPTLSPIFLRAVKNEDLEVLFDLPCVYSNPICIDAANQFQKAFFTIRRFPLVSFFANSSSLLALFNTSIVASTHFVDLFVKPAIDFICQSEFDEASKVCDSFPEMIDYASLLSMEKEKKSEDYYFISQVVKYHFEHLSSQSATNSEVSTNSEEDDQIQFKNINELFERLKGDVSLIEDVKFYLGYLPSLGQIREQSVVKIFLFFLKSGNFEPFRQLRSRILYSVTDEDWVKDNDFISGYFVLSNTIKAIETNDEQFYDEIALHITEIQSITFLRSLSIDLYSMLFLTKPNEASNKESFFVSRETAERILRILIDADNTDDGDNILSLNLSSALRKIQYANVLFPDDPSVSTLMLSADKYFALALERKEIGIFGQIAQSDEKESGSATLKRIILAAKQVLEFQQKLSETEKTDNDFKDFNDDSKQEIICSFELQNDEIQKLCSDLLSSQNEGEEIRILLKKKQSQIIQSSIEFIQFPFVKFASSSSNSFHEVCDFLSLSSLEKNKTWKPLLSLVSTLIDDKSFLSTFLHYLDTLVPPLLAATNCSIAKCLDFDPLIAVSQLVNDGKVEQASSLSNSLGYSVSEALIRSKSTSPQCLEILQKENPVLSVTTVFYSKLKDDDEIPSELLGNSQSLQKYIKNKNKKEKENNNLLFFDQEKQEGASKDEIESIIQFLLKKNPLPVDELSDVLYRINEDEFINITMNSNILLNFGMDELNALIEICNLNGFEKFEKIVGIFIDVLKVTRRKPFPLENSFSSLLTRYSNQDQSSYSIIQRLCLNCSTFFNPSEIILKTIVDLSKQQKWEKIRQLLKIDQSLLDKLPRNIVDKINSEEAYSKSEEWKTYIIDDIDKKAFFESVPDFWDVLKTPLETVIENASDRENASWLVSSFPSLQVMIADEVTRRVSNVAQSDEPIEKRASSIADDIQTFLPLMKDAETKAEVAKHSIRQLLFLASKLSALEDYLELQAFNDLKGINKAFKIIQNECKELLMMTDNVNHTNSTTQNQTENVNHTNSTIQNQTENVNHTNPTTQNQAENTDKISSDAKVVNQSNSLIGICSSVSHRLSAALKFIGQFPCTKFNVQYSFENFTEEATGELIAKLCFQLDMLGTAREIGEAWGVTNYDSLRDDYAIKCVELGIDGISHESEYKGFPSKGKLQGEKIDENDGFYIWKFATDRRQTSPDKCSSKAIQKFIDAYRHRSFYDSRICSRLVDLSEVNSIHHSEFLTALPSSPVREGGDKEEHEGKGTIQPSNSFTSSISPSSSIFMKFFRSHITGSSSEADSLALKSFIGDDGELDDHHFFSRIEKLCLLSSSSQKKPKNESEEADKSDFDSSDLSSVLLSLGSPTSDLPESLFPGTPALLSRYLSACAPFYEVARYHASIGEFEAAFMILEENLTSPDQFTCFERDLLMPAVERGRVGEFFNVAVDFIENLRTKAAKKELKKEDKIDGEIVGGLAVDSVICQMFERLLKMSQEESNRLAYFELCALVSLGHYELAAFTAVSDIKTADSTDSRLRVIDFAFACAAAFIKKESEKSPFLINSDIDQIDSQKVQKLRAKLNLSSTSNSDSKSSMLFLIRLLPLQRHFCENIETCDLNIFDFAASVDAMIVFLLLRQEFQQAVELMFTYPDSVNVHRIGSSLIDILINENDEKIKSVIAGIERDTPLSNFRQLIVSMVNRAQFFLGDERFVSLIVKVIKNPKLKCALLIQIGNLEEALAIAKESCSDFLPLIGNYAGHEGKVQVLADAVRAIEKIEKEKKS